MPEISIPLDFVIAIFGIALLLFGVLFLIQRRRKRGAAAQPPAPTPLWKRVLRLTGFTLLAIVWVLVGLMLYTMTDALISEVRVAPSAVEIPADLGFEVEEVSFTGGEGYRLAGWYVPSRNGATLILLHGYGGNRLGMRWYAEQLVAEGYGVLMYDERASGESEGDKRGFGWIDPPDVDGAVAYLRARAGQDVHLGILGCSIGGQIALQSAVRNPQLEAVWADGPSMLRAADYPTGFTGFGDFLIATNYLYDWMYAARLWMLPPRPLIEQIDEIAPRPVMLVGGGVPNPIYGSEKGVIERYASYGGDNVDTWLISEGVHCDGHEFRPDEYRTRMLAFFSAALHPEE